MNIEKINKIDYLDDNTKLNIKTDNSTYLIEYRGNGVNFKYRSYIINNGIQNNGAQEIIEKNKQKEIANSIVLYKVKGLKTGILMCSEYGFYIYAHSIGICNSFCVNMSKESKLLDSDIGHFKLLFNRVNRNKQKEFFSIVLNTGEDDEKTDDQNTPHVSTLIVDCKNDELYLFDTSQDTHQISNKTNVNSKIIEINKKIHILNKIKDEPLQSGGCCTIWTSIINSKLAEHNKIEEVINTKTHQLQPEFFRDVVNSVGAFRNKDIKLVDINNCNELFKIITNNNNAEIILENAVQNSYLEKQKNKTQNNKTKQDTNIDTIGHNNDTYYKSEKRLNPVQTPVQNIQHEQDIQPQNIQKTDMQRAQEAVQHMLKNNANIMHTGKNMEINKVLNKQIQTKQNTKTELTLN